MSSTCSGRGNPSPGKLGIHFGKIWSIPEPVAMRRGVLRACTLHRSCRWKASEVDYVQTLHVYIVKHDPFGPFKVVVGVSIALHTLLLALP